MLKLVFMVEEASMKICLDSILEKLLESEENICFQVIPHSGKSDLEKSIQRKLKAFRNYDGMKYKFFILRDQDNGDCIKIKDRLKNLCINANRPDSIIRIVCQELESWFIGDLDAIERGMNITVKNKMKKKYRKPDTLGNPSEEIKKICNNSYSKVGDARKISKFLSLTENKSHSYNVFLSAVSNILNKEQYA